MGVSEHLLQIGIAVDDPPRLRVQDDDAVLRRLEEPAVSDFRGLQGRFDPHSLGRVDIRGEDFPSRPPDKLAVRSNRAPQRGEVSNARRDWPGLSFHGSFLLSFSSRRLAPGLPESAIGRKKHPFHCNLRAGLSSTLSTSPATCFLSGKKGEEFPDTRKFRHSRLNLTSRSFLF